MFAQVTSNYWNKEIKAITFLLLKKRCKVNNIQKGQCKFKYEHVFCRPDLAPHIIQRGWIARPMGVW